MNDPVSDRPDEDEREGGKEPPSPDDLVSMYGGFLMIAVPLVLIIVILYFIFR